MKILHTNFIEKLAKETGLECDYISDKFTEALDYGIVPIDFF